MKFWPQFYFAAAGSTVFIWFSVASLAAEPKAVIDSPIVGAIRWDAWYGTKGAVKNVEVCLGPPKYHFRLPFFARIVGDAEVSINGDSQEIMEKEIHYAAHAGLNYWAFVDYGDDPDLTIALRRYRATKDKLGLRYCLIEEGHRIDGHGANYWPRLIEHFKDPNYQTVLDGRPLLYVFLKTEKLDDKEWRKLGDQAIAAGLKRPYLVLMGGRKPERDAAAMKSLGFDAVSAYSGRGAYTMNPPTYAEVCEGIRKDRWEKCSELKIPSVTFASTGWDTRPRNERPPPWIKAVPVGMPDNTPPSQQKPLIDAVTATPEELSQHLRDALKWTRENRAINPSQAIIIYAWNENDEGGWLIPTLGSNGQPNTERIEAVRRVLRPD